MKILYISPYHVSGTLPLWVKEHERRGNECRYVTLFPNDYGFPEDICLNLPFYPDKSWIARARRRLYKFTRGPEGQDTPITTIPPYWEADGPLAKVFFAFRDMMTKGLIEKSINKLDLDSFDIIHLDQGQGFLRNGYFVRRWHSMGKKIAAFYHGSDMRNRGIFPVIDETLGLRLTSELDLTYLDSRLQYLFLPFDTEKWKPRPKVSSSSKLKIVHTARNKFKGTETIVNVVKELEKSYPVELVLIQGGTHQEAMALKADSDIAIDQIADTGGWGYGMSSVEYLSLGVPTCTSMIKEYVDFIPDHPFVAVTSETLRDNLVRLIEDEPYRRLKGEEGREWVVKYHDIKSVGDQLYWYYDKAGWLNEAESSGL